MLFVFVVPEKADTIGNKTLNTKIRTFKNILLTQDPTLQNPKSIVEMFVSGAQDTIKETTDTYTHIETTVKEKAEQVQKTADSVQKAYDAVEQAKKDIQNLTNLSGALKK
jgi:peptidoglycan hydrolase CwlO-like protein